MARAIGDGGTGEAILEIARSEGFRTMRETAEILLEAGATTVDAVDRALGE